MAPSIKLAHAIGGPILLVILLALGMYLRQRCRRTVEAMIMRRTNSLPEAEREADARSRQAYLQQKAELRDEESRLYELAAKDKSPETGADDQSYELPGSERSEETKTLQELKGEEHSKELEAPQW